MIPPVVMHTLTPPAEIWASHRATAYTLAACAEIPDPDHDIGGLSVTPVTGAPSEFSQVSPVNFIVPRWTPWKTRKFASDFSHRGWVQTRRKGTPIGDGSARVREFRLALPRVVP